MKNFKRHKRAIRRTLLVLITSLSLPLHASETGYLSHCAACHMGDASGNPALKAPSIAGLETDYLVRQLKGFRQGLRGHAQDDSAAQSMRSIARSLSETEITAISQYVAALPVPELAIEKQPASFRGRGLYSECASCHGAQGKGNSALNAPRIAHQYPWYLKQQLKNFKAGIRGSSAEDRIGAQMAVMAAEINDSDLDTLVNHITNLGR